MPDEYRSVEQIIPSRSVTDGAGVSIRRIADSTQLDPFLMLDEFGSDDPDDYIAGFPEHPHRGFETVTYMLAGYMEHRDSAGNQGRLGPGSVQWMTAGRGILHSEMPLQEDGLMRGFQLWVNLPAKDKMKAPRYQELGADEVPVVEHDGTTVKIVAGSYREVLGAVNGIATDPTYLDVSLRPSAAFEHALPDDHTTFVYVFRGAGGNRGRIDSYERRDRLRCCAQQEGGSAGRARRRNCAVPATRRTPHPRASRAAGSLRNEHPDRDRAGDPGLSIRSSRLRLYRQSEGQAGRLCLVDLSNAAGSYRYASVELGSIHDTIDESEAVPAGANLCAVGLPLRDIHRGIAELQHDCGALLGCSWTCERGQGDGEHERDTSGG